MYIVIKDSKYPAAGISAYALEGISDWWGPGYATQGGELALISACILFIPLRGYDSCA